MLTNPRLSFLFTGKADPPQTSVPQLCRLKKLNSSAKDYDRYKLCLQSNINLLLPLFSSDANITDTFRSITNIINRKMQSPERQQGLTIPATTRKTLNDTNLEIISIKHNTLLFKVLLPKLEDTPKIGNILNMTFESIERASDLTNVTIEGRLAVENGDVEFSNVVVKRIDAIISDFVAEQNEDEETVSFTKTNVSEDGDITLDKEVLKVMNIVFRVVQGNYQASN